MEKRLLFTFYLLLFTVPLTSLKAEEPVSVLKSYLQGLESYSATFEQQLFNEQGIEVEKSSGIFYLRQPGMFHWAYAQPYSQMLISDGATLWIYEEDLEQVIIRDLGDSLGGSPAAILAGDIDINEHYVVLDLGESQGTTWMELTPRDLESQYSSVRLGFKDKQLAKMLLFDNLGQKNLISFLDIKKNASLDIELFGFEAPEGTDIIDNRQ